jgi:hypothetical protein
MEYINTFTTPNNQTSTDNISNKLESNLEKDKDIKKSNEDKISNNNNINNDDLKLNLKINN